ncbi:MAG: P-loop NTPase [Halobacteriovoraceae bacterium]|nr:P-loop NTPase [Halobacteriovoraceae bacterium]
MTDKIVKIIGDIINPASGKSLSFESRILGIDRDETSIKIKYGREFISPANKEIIEADIKKQLTAYYRPKQISIIAVNRSSAKSNPTPSNGKTPNNKKRIPGVKKVIGVSSAKGGVGKSTVAVNLAFALKNMDKKVGLVDADIYGPSLPILLGKKSAKPTGNADKKIIPINAHGVPFISFGLFIGEKDPVIWRGPMLGGVLNQFLFDVIWEDLDYMIIDLPPGTGDMQLSLGQMAEVDGVLTVSTPQDVALLDAKKGLLMFQKLQIPSLGLIENMSYFITPDSSKKYFIFGKGGVKKAAKELKVNFLGDIPLEMTLRESCDEGIPYMAQSVYENQPVWKSYMEIAQKIDKMMKNK